MKSTWLIAAAALAAATFSHASAEDEACILNLEGDVVCGDEAEAERRRQREKQIEAMNGRAAGTSDKSAGSASPSPDRVRRGPRPARSVYGSFGQAAFLRGGYVFASSREGVDASPAAGLFAAGLMKPIKRFGRHVLSAEVEALYFRDADSVEVLGADVTSKLWGITGLFSARYQFDTGWIVDPFASAGLGPAYYRAALATGGVRTTESSMVLGYGARAGLTAAIGDNLAIEGAYRFFGSTFDGASSIQAAEVGVNLAF